jgi:hypothetical protein
MTCANEMKIIETKLPNNKLQVTSYKYQFTKYKSQIPITKLSKYGFNKLWKFGVLDFGDLELGIYNLSNCQILIPCTVRSWSSNTRNPELTAARVIAGT